MSGAKKKTKGGILAKIKSVSYTLIPLNELRDLPTRRGLGIIATFYLLLVMYFIYLVVNGFYLHKNDKFLSLEEEQYKGFGTCENVPRMIDGRYTVDYNGNWDKSLDFKHSLGVYDLIFTKFEGTMEQYQFIISTALEEYDYIGSLFTTQNLGYNILVWMAFSDTAVFQGKKQVMSLTGDPKAVFNRKRRTAQLGNVRGTCDVSPTVQYDATSSVITVAYNIEEFRASATCKDILDITNETTRFESAWTDEREDFTLKIDMSSLVTASAINQGILPTYELEMIPYSEYLLDLNGVDYTSAMFFYPYFDNMDPLSCVYRANATAGDSNIRKEELFCAMQLTGGYYGMPLFNHMGRSYDVPTPCDCSEEANTADSVFCNTFQFISGFVFYKDVDDLAELLLDVYKDRKGSELNTDALNATFGTLSKNETMRNASDWRSKAFSFCQLRSGKNCSVLSIFTGDIEAIYTMNHNYMQLPWGSCNNTISVSNASKEAILNTPPDPLSEPYFECKKYPISTLSDEFSAAVGIIIPLRLLMIFILALLLIVMSKYDKKFYNTHTFREKHKALDFFANCLLLIRDGNFNTDKKHDMETLIRLQQELKHLGDIPKFYEVQLNGSQATFNSTSTYNANSSADSGTLGRQSSVTGVSKTFLDAIENPLRPDSEL